MGFIVIVLVVKIVSVDILFLIRVSFFLEPCCFDAMCFRAGYMVRVFVCQLFCMLVGGGFAVCRYFVGMSGASVSVGFLWQCHSVFALLFFGVC